jgi:soluble lytic murein transglycosylase-like protein
MSLFAAENKFDHEFLTEAVALKIPVSVLKGFAALESAFNDKAHREEPAIKDASYGLMQILFKTAQGVGYKGTADGLFDPATNIHFGGLFLKGLLQKYPNVLDAIAAYNMGYPRKASATTETIKKIYGAPAADWVYANQPYVDRVASYIAYYQALENTDKSKAATILDLIKKKDCRKAALSLDPFLLGSFRDQWPAR